MATERLSFEDTLRNTNIMLRTMGIPPCGEFYPASGVALLRRNIAFLGSFLLLAYTTLGEMIYLVQLFQREVNFLEVTFQTPCIGYCLIGVVKMIILAVRRDTIAELVALFRTKWKMALVSNEHWRVCEATMRPAIRVTSLTALVNIVMGIAFTILPIAEMIYHRQLTGSWTRQLSFNIWWPFDVFDGAKYFWAIYPLYVVIGFTGIIIHMAFDCLFCILAAHLCMHFRILKHNVERLVELSEKEEEEEEEEEKRGANEGRLQETIVKHQDLISCSAFLQDVFGDALFINFLGSSIIICIQAFMITTVTGYTLIKFVLFMLCFLIELLMLCAYGEGIVQSSGDIAGAAYDCLWYAEPRPFQASVLQMLHSAQRPIVLTAWKIWPIQMVTFGSILKASWSYFTLLKTVYGDK